MDKKNKIISGFSKLSKRGKIKWIVENFFKDPETVMLELTSYWHDNEEQQRVLDGFSENTLSNFPMPFGVAPNFLIDGKTYCVPMVIEESSVVAAASAAAKFWLNKGGFQTEIIGTKKLGHVHFKWNGNPTWLNNQFRSIKAYLLEDTKEITANMEKRGGGISDIILKDLTDEIPGLFQIEASFETCDSMGANFINSCLEQFAKTLKAYIFNLGFGEEDLDIIMCILSNYTPECCVKAWVECDIEELDNPKSGIKGREFAERFSTAIKIAEVDSFRATTHNKGIFNGIDAVVLATGNDFRAVEACGHTYASKSGKYSSLSHCEIKDGKFKFWLEIPFALGTVGGLTALHPIAKRSLELLGNPSAEELMRIVAATGLAQNFAAIRSLTTTGIQKGHMKMHLMNILNHFQATEEEIKKSVHHFTDKVISYNMVREFLLSIRKT